MAANTQRTKPKVRFGGFEDSWSMCPIGSILSAVPFKNYLAEPKTHGDFPVIQQGDSPIAGYADGNPFKAFENAVLFGDHSLSIYRPQTPFFVATDGLRIITSETIVADFLFYLLERYKPNNEGYKRYYSILVQQTSSLPLNKSEQRQIGLLLSKIDTFIVQQQRKYDRLVSIKKALLGKLFPKEGEAVPEIRFAGSKGEWEQKKIRDLGSILTGSTPSSQNEKYYDRAGIPWVTPTDINSTITCETEKRLSVAGQSVARVVPPGTILVTCIASIGKNTMLATSGSFN